MKPQGRKEAIQFVILLFAGMFSVFGGLVYLTPLITIKILELFLWFVVGPLLMIAIPFIPMAISEHLYNKERRKLKKIDGFRQTKLKALK